MRVLVTGATGNLGSSISKTLSDNGHNIILASRSENNIKGVANSTTIVFDYSNKDTYQSATDNIDAIVLIAPPMDPFSDKKLIPFIDYANKRGIDKFLMISAFGVNHNPDAGLTKIENHLAKTGARYAIVRPNFFMDNFTKGFVKTTIDTDKAMYLAAGKGKTSFISTNDIARVVAIIINDINEHNGKAFDITGAEAIDHYQVAEILSENYGEKINYIAISEDDMKKGAVESGMPESSADMMIALYQATSAGYLSGVTDVFNKITGESPQFLKDFVKG
jgi:uncharacterized protein YbjT (DUF2867 family)